MAENEQSQERTEEPTQRRLDKAREDGEVLSSKEMPLNKFTSGGGPFFSFKMFLASKL